MVVVAMTTMRRWVAMKRVPGLGVFEVLCNNVFQLFIYLGIILSLLLFVRKCQRLRRVRPCYLIIIIIVVMNHTIFNIVITEASSTGR